MGFLEFLLLLLILAVVILVFLHQWLELAMEQAEVLYLGISMEAILLPRFHFIS